jgi:hypothetical protein
MSRGGHGLLPCWPKLAIHGHQYGFLDLLLDPLGREHCSEAKFYGFLEQPTRTALYEVHGGGVLSWRHWLTANGQRF